MGVYQDFTGKRNGALAIPLGHQKCIMGLGKDLECSCFPSSILFPFPLSPCLPALSFSVSWIIILNPFLLLVPSLLLPMNFPEGVL